MTRIVKAARCYSNKAQPEEKTEIKYSDPIKNINEKFEKI